MKGRILILLTVLLLAASSFAQKQEGKSREELKKEIMDFKLKFLADEIELKEDQKKQFDETYTQMETERRSIFKKIKAAEKHIKENKNASEADYEKASSEMAKGREEMTQVEKRYDEKFSTFLTKKQMFKLKEAEGKFMETMRKTRDAKKHNKHSRNQQ